ncbi:MAG: 30S ribosomal protein S3 [Candidatus Eisenbacteria bacterium]|nr:30S ribosomal protein S3 [Candidatus Eisenbacteria bacterium]
MGQKVHPVGMRLGINRTWKSRWFAKKNYAELLKEDLTIRKYVTTKLSRAGISDVIIERKADKVVVNVRTARPGIVIGRKGIEVERLNKELEHLTSRDIRINILEVKKVELDAQLVAEHIAKQLESRMGFRRAVRKAVESTMRMGAKGIKIRCAGRLGGSEMSRVQEYHEGRVPLHTLRADIDFARATARTTHGAVGVKVWIFKGETLGGMVDDLEEDKRAQKSQRDSFRGRRDGRSDRGRGDRPPRRGARSGGRNPSGGRSGGSGGRSSGGRSGGSAGRSGSGRPPSGGRPASGSRPPRRSDAGKPAPSAGAGQSGGAKPATKKSAEAKPAVKKGAEAKPAVKKSGTNEGS